MYICEEKTVITVYTIVVTLTLVQISEVWYWNLHVIHDMALIHTSMLIVSTVTQVSIQVCK